jgi:hypothetical protein
MVSYEAYYYYVKNKESNQNEFFEESLSCLCILLFCLQKLLYLLYFSVLTVFNLNM